MSNEQEPVPLHHAIGARLRELRQERGLRQDDVALAARHWGVDWTQPTVAAIEAGARPLAVEELLLLPVILFEGIELPDLLPGDGWVDLDTPMGTTVLRRAALRRLLEGRYAAAPKTRRVAEVIHANAPGRGIELTADRPQEEERAQAVSAAAGGDAERKAARKLSIPPIEVSEAAYARYGRSLTAERDRRVAEQAPADASPRSLQALRGHVTRALLSELDPILNQKGRRG